MFLRNKFNRGREQYPASALAYTELSFCAWINSFKGFLMNHFTNESNQISTNLPFLRKPDRSNAGA